MQILLTLWTLRLWDPQEFSDHCYFKLPPHTQSPQDLYDTSVIIIPILQIRRQARWACLGPYSHEEEGVGFGQSVGS